MTTLPTWQSLPQTARDAIGEKTIALAAVNTEPLFEPNRRMIRTEREKDLNIAIFRELGLDEAHAQKAPELLKSIEEWHRLGKSPNAPTEGHFAPLVAYATQLAEAIASIKKDAREELNIPHPTEKTDAPQKGWSRS